MNGWTDNDLELAWAAGFFDGEGSIYVVHKKRCKGGTTGKYYPNTGVELSISQIHPQPLERFLSAVKTGSMSGPYKPKKENHSPYWRWNTAGRPTTYKVVCLLWPFLSTPKREQIKRCWEELKRCKSKKSPQLQELPL